MSRVVILSQSIHGDLSQQAKLVEQVFREAQALRWLPIASIDHLDPYQLSNPKPVDIQIHLEIPCRQAWIWSKLNIVVINPSTWIRGAWDWATKEADWAVFKSPEDATLFPEIPESRRWFLPWRTQATSVTSVDTVNVGKKENKVLYIVGDSRLKQAAAKQVMEAWKPRWPALEIWGSSVCLGELRTHRQTKQNVELWNTESDCFSKQAMQKAAKFHCVASAGERFGVSMAECAAAGSIPLWVGGQDYVESIWGFLLGKVGRIVPLRSQQDSSPSPSPSFSPSSPQFQRPPVTLTSSAVESAMQTLLNLNDDAYMQMASALQKRCAKLNNEFRAAWKQILTSPTVLKQLRTRPQPFVPKRLPKEQLPTVAIVTLTHNRPKWFANMTRNILMADYPTDKLVWVLVDDSDGMGRIDDQVQRFREKTPDIRLEYVSLSKKTPIGAKRNRGCRAALAVNSNVEIFLMMDDDDHYPKSSIEARVSYLKELKKGCVYCSTLPMYDCVRYISAMNVPPMDLSPAERVSEASMAFTRQFWEARPFPADCSIAEGEGFLAGRESETAEIPPDGILVSFLHGTNSTSRRIPAVQEPNGCHYGFDDEYFTYISERGLDRLTH